MVTAASVLLAVVALAAPVAEGAGLLDRAEHPVFFGIDVPGDDPALIAAATRDAGVAPTVDNVFVKLDSTGFGPATLQRIGARRMTPMVSLEPWSYRNGWGQTELPQYRLSALAAGEQDRALASVARVVAGFRGPVYLRFAHEMNGWWYPWAIGRNGNTAADFVAAWRHTRQVFRAAGATNARFVWAPNALTGSRRETPLEFAYPGDADVDLIGMTAYGHGASPADTFDATYARLAALTSKRIVLAETGVDGPRKAEWLASFGDWVSRHGRVVGFVWFNTTPASTGASGDYRFNDTQASSAAFRASLRRLRLRPP